MEKITTAEQLKAKTNIKYLIWIKKVGEQTDFSVIRRKYNDRLIVEDYSNLNTDNPTEGKTKTIYFRDINWLVWNLFIPNQEEGELKYKELLVKNLNKK